MAVRGEEETRIDRRVQGGGEPGEVVDVRVEIRREAERIAEAHGIDADEIIAEAEAILKGGDGNRND